MIKDYQTNYYYTKITNKALKKKQSKKFDEVFYEKYNNKIEDITFGKFLESSYTIGCCHFYAMLLAKNTPNSVLKVGELKTLEASVRDEYLEPFEHSWVEVGDYVLDTTARQIFKKDYYYKVFEPVAYKTYSQNDLCDEKLFLTHMYWALKNREFFLEDTFNKYFKNKYQKYKNDKKFVDNLNKIKKEYSILIDPIKNKEEIIEK